MGSINDCTNDIANKSNIAEWFDISKRTIVCHYLKCSPDKDTWLSGY